MASQIASLTIVYSTVYSEADQRKHQSSTWLAFVMEIHRWPVNSPHRGPVTWQMFPFDNVMMMMHNDDVCINKIHFIQFVTHSWWRHQMETFSALLAICAGNSPAPGEQHEGQWRGALMFSLICAWINGWVNNGEAGDLRCHRAHYDVIVM